MELLTILLLLVFLLEEGLKLALLSLKFLKRLGKIRKQFREEKMPESSHTLRRSQSAQPDSLATVRHVEQAGKSLLLKVWIKRCHLKFSPASSPGDQDAWQVHADP